MNGGRCSLVNDEVECSCPKEYKGLFCETPVLRDCFNKNFGDNIPNPSDPKTFLVCLHLGHYSIKLCPGGLVFNEFEKRCDYSNTKPSTDLGACMANVNPCQNSGVCIPKLDKNEYMCECKAGFTGINCEENIDDCKMNQCGPNGKCVDLINGHVCMCGSTHYGENCLDKKVPIPCKETIQITRHTYPFDQSVIVECDQNQHLTVRKCPASLIWYPMVATCDYPFKVYSAEDKCSVTKCRNGSRCKIDKFDNPICECQPGYEGVDCEINIDDCTSNPCMNNGKCVDGLNMHHCVCENKFIDKDCSYVKAENPCVNVLNEYLSKKDNTVRYPHPFTKEKFLVCNIEGYAQVLDCPEGQIWKQDEQTCDYKLDQLSEIYQRVCKNRQVDFKLTYPYSDVKYARCIGDGYEIKQCPKEVPYFCECKSQCVADIVRDCKLF